MGHDPITISLFCLHYIVRPILHWSFGSRKMLLAVGFVRLHQDRRFKTRYQRENAVVKQIR